MFRVHLYIMDNNHLKKSDTKTKKATTNAFLVFDNNIKIGVKASGKHGIYYGYLCCIDGDFSLKELNKINNEQQFFITDCINIELNSIKTDKHNIIIADSFVDFEENKKNPENTTIISNLSLSKLKSLVNLENINYIRCAIFYPDDFENINEQQLVEINNNLSHMEQFFYKNNLFKDYNTNFKPYFIHKTENNDFNHKFKYFSILEKDKKTVAVIDFGISKSLQELLQKYFNIILLPVNETALHIEYLYKDKKIDGVILSDFIYNTSFVPANIKDEIKKLAQTKIPILCFEASAYMIAEIFGSQTSIINSCYEVDIFDVENIKHKQYKTTKFYYKRIEFLSQNFRHTYYDRHANIVGFESKNKSITCYCFNLTHNSIDVAFFLNEFYKKIVNARKY